jgi:hypothetical protein
MSLFSIDQPFKGRMSLSNMRLKAKAVSDLHSVIDFAINFVEYLCEFEAIFEKAF